MNKYIIISITALKLLFGTFDNYYSRICGYYNNLPYVITDNEREYFNDEVERFFKCV